MPEREITTIHEAEGITRKQVYLIRLDKDNCHLYEGVENRLGNERLNQHQLVGISRHTEKLVYLFNYTC